MSELIMLIFLILFVIVSCKDCQWSTSWFSNELMECSGVGSCNRDKGICECFDGFEGVNCEKMSCPSNDGKECSGHGRCLTMKELKGNSGDKKDEKYRGCICDIGYSGYDCHIKECPLGAVKNKGNFKKDVIEYTTTRQLRRGLATINFPITVTMENKDILKTVTFEITNSMTAEDIRKKILNEKIVHDVGVEKLKDKIIIYYLYDNDVGITKINDGDFTNPNDATIDDNKLQTFAECSGLGECNNGNCECYGKDDEEYKYPTDPYTTYKFKVPIKNCQKFGDYTLSNSICLNGDIQRELSNNIVEIEKNITRHIRGKNEYNIPSNRILQANICIPGCSNPTKDEKGNEVNPCKDEYCVSNCEYLCKNHKSLCQTNCPSEVDKSLNDKKELDKTKLEKDKKECIESICTGNCDDFKEFGVDDCKDNCMTESLRSYNVSVCKKIFDNYENVVCDNHCSDKYKNSIYKDKLCSDNCKSYTNKDAETENTCKGDCNTIKTQEEVTCDTGCDVYIENPKICDTPTTKLDVCKTTLDTCKKTACNKQSPSSSTECDNSVDYFGLTLSTCESKCGSDEACKSSCITYIDEISTCLNTYSTCITDLPTGISNECITEACKLTHESITGSASGDSCQINFADVNACNTECDATFTGNVDNISKCKASCQLYFKLKGMCENQDYFPSNALDSCKTTHDDAKKAECDNQCSIRYDSSNADFTACQKDCESNPSIISLTECNNACKSRCSSVSDSYNTAITTYETCSKTQLDTSKTTCNTNLCNEECDLLYVGETQKNKDCKSSCPSLSNQIDCTNECSDSHNTDRKNCKENCNVVVPRLNSFRKVDNCVETISICETVYNDCNIQSRNKICTTLYSKDCKDSSTPLPTTVKECKDKCNTLSIDVKKTDCLTSCNTYFEDISFCRNSYQACGDSFYELFANCKKSSLNDCKTACNDNNCINGCTTAESSTNTESCKANCNSDTNCIKGCNDYFTKYKSCNIFSSTNTAVLVNPSKNKCKINACNILKKYDGNTAKCTESDVTTGSSDCTAYCDGKVNNTECEVRCEFYKKEYEKCDEISSKDIDSLCLVSANYIRNEICGSSDCVDVDVGNCEAKCNNDNCKLACKAYYEYLSYCEVTQIPTDSVKADKTTCESKCNNNVECKSKCDSDISGMCDNYRNSLEVVYLSQNELLTCSEVCVGKYKEIIERLCNSDCPTNPVDVDKCKKCKIENYNAKCGCSINNKDASSSLQTLSEECINECDKVKSERSVDCKEICYASYYYDGSVNAKYTDCKNECESNYTLCESICRDYYYSSSLNTLKNCVAKCNTAKDKCNSECNKNIRYYECKNKEDKSCKINTQSIKVCDNGCKDQCLDDCNGEDKCKIPNCVECGSCSGNYNPINNAHNNQICKCKEGYEGNKCDKKQCVFTDSWFGLDRINACSNRGNCNNGECECDNGFNSINDGCSTIDCDNNCNDNGICKYKRIDDDRDIYIGHCECFDGFEGNSCNEIKTRKCPTAAKEASDNPKLEITLTTYPVTILYEDIEYTIPNPKAAQQSCDNLKEILEGKSGGFVGEIKCDDTNSASNKYTLAFTYYCGDALDDKIKVEGAESIFTSGGDCVECLSGKCTNGYCTCNTGSEYDIVRGICINKT